jgi:hypothetical protein
MQEAPRTQLLRHNMKDLIFKTRKELRRKRSLGHMSSSSDGFDMDMDDEETDDQVLDEEVGGFPLFLACQRVRHSANEK